MIHRHHRKRRSQGGDDSPVNVIDIPDELHEWIHRNPAKAYELGLLVRSHEDPAEVVVTIPEDVVAVKKPRKKREPGKKKAVFSIRVPRVDVESGEPFQEDGAALLEERVERLRELLCPILGWDEDVPAYFPIIAGLDKGIEAIEFELAEEGEFGPRLDRYDSPPRV